jgi:hypothetical protein
MDNGTKVKYFICDLLMSRDPNEVSGDARQYQRVSSGWRKSSDPVAVRILRNHNAETNTNGE